MTVAWTTLLAISLLLPGIAVVLGFSSSERHAREVVRTNVIGDVALAVFAALTIHIAAGAILSMFGFRSASLARLIVIFEQSSAIWQAEILLRWLVRLSTYIVVSSMTGFLVGCVIGRLTVSGPLRALATHRWASEILKFGAGRRGLVTAYVLTTTAEEGKVIMYKGRLSDFFIGSDGRIAYLVVQDAARYALSFEDKEVELTKAQIIFEDGEASTESRWNYLMIQGDTIANVSFDKSAAVADSGKGRSALQQALDASRHE